MVDTFRVAPDEWECRVFIAVVEEYGAEAAAQRLRALRGGGYERQSVEKILKKLENWVGERLLERYPDRKLYLTPRGEKFLESARNLVTLYDLMREERAAPSRVATLACLPHHAHFVAVAEDLLYGREPGVAEPVRVTYLPERHRGDAEFHRHAVALLRAGAYQLIIGPRVDDTDFESRLLYAAQLEAMMPRSFPANELALSDLVAEHRMLVPPVDVRSRRLLESRLREAGITDPGDATPADAAYETAASVMRIRREAHRQGSGESRVVVAPSDVALAFKAGMEFGGRGAERFKWVPIFDRDDEGNDHLLRVDVCVTYRRGSHPQVPLIVMALEEAVRRLNTAPDHVGLSGEPFRGRPAHVPPQRQPAR